MFVYSSSLRLSFLQKALLAFFWVYLKQIFCSPSPTGCTGSEPSAIPCLLSPDPPAYSSRLMDISVALPLLRSSLRSSFPTSLQFPLIFYRAWIEKDKYGIYPGVLSSLSRSGCPELFTTSAASPAALGTRSGGPHPSPLHPIKATLPARLRARL